MDEDNLKVVDVTDKLTTEEVKELKNLAQLSRTAKWMMAGAIAVVSLFGMDKVAAFFSGK